MPVTINQYGCTKCQTRFDTYVDAVSCESLPCSPQEHQIGDIVSVYDETSLIGTRYSYTTVTATVLYAFLQRVTDRDTGEDRHGWFYVLSPNTERSMFGSPEIMATYMKQEFGGVTLTSLAEWKYRAGFAKAIQNDHARIG